jgi:hypothetical protein
VVNKAAIARDELRRSRTVYVSERVQLDAVTRFLAERENSASPSDAGSVQILREMVSDGAVSLAQSKARYERATQMASAALAAVQVEAGQQSGSDTLKFSDASMSADAEGEAGGGGSAAAVADTLAAELSAVGASSEVEAFLTTLAEEQLRQGFSVPIALEGQ